MVFIGELYCILFFTEEVPVALMIAAGAGAVAVILFLGLAGYGYHRCKHSDNGKQWEIYYAWNFDAWLKPL